MNANPWHDFAVHIGHCNFGEHVGSCKYGDDSCPSLKDWSWFGKNIQRSDNIVKELKEWLSENYGFALGNDISAEMWESINAIVAKHDHKNFKSIEPMAELVRVYNQHSSPEEIETMKKALLELKPERCREEYIE